ncbi:MAG: TonB-dependent receptor plug domain-containing protein [Colwellia sp.]|nr:TonB-dependent receptor plug domain-containing protein [Colwellia sp.]
MRNTNIKRSFNRSLAAIAVGTILATSTMSFAASNTTGSIYGQAKEGAVITFKNRDTGLSRSITITDNGRFNFKSVPPGVYEVTTSNGSTRVVQVVVGTGSSVIFTQDDTEVITVTGSVLSVIDTSSVESTRVFTQDQIELLPVGRNTTAIALLTPGTVPGDPTFGNLPSFGGSSVAENGYYIDGFDVTNIRSFLSFATIPFDAISQTQVKTGGYGAEFGRSLGGVTNTIIKSGTNDWKFGASVYYTPDSLRGDYQDVEDLNQTDGTLTVYQSDFTRTSLEYNFSAGGPIIEDTLFVYANIMMQNDEREYFNRVDSNTREVSTPNGLIKLDWYITDDHIINATYIQNETDVDRVFYENPEDAVYTGQHGEETTRYTEENGGSIFVVNYTGHITDDLSVSVMYGQLEDLWANKVPRNPDPEAALCARAIDTTGDLTWGNRVNVGCWNTAQSNVSDPEPESARDERESFKIDLDYTWEDHTFRVGYNSEEFTSYTLGTQYTGGVYYRYFESAEKNGGVINRVDLPYGTQAVRVITNDVKSGSFQVDNSAFYIEDSWQVNDEWMVYLGLRNETFTNYAENGDIFVEADGLIAPRLGFSWDVNGDSTAKVYGTLGRYYIPIAGNTNIRATRLQSGGTNYYHVDGFDEATGLPINQGAAIGTGFFDNQVPDPRVIAVTDLDPMHQDELILGYQQELGNDWTGGVKLMYRKIQDGMDDFCAHDGFYQWGLDQGYAMANEANDWHTPEGGFDVGSMQGCIMINPGKTINIFADTNGDGEVQEISVDNSYFGLPEYKRSYKGLEFTLEKAWSDDWYVNLSYVWSKSEGNIEGYVNSTLGQEDPGATQDFDHKRFQDGSDGYLPNDRRHVLKGYGAYKITDELTFTANVNLSSGTPLSCNGFIPLEGMMTGDGSTVYDAPNFDQYGASTFYCASESGTPELSSRGAYGRTEWTYMVDAGLSYMPTWAEGLTLQVDVFNLFDFDEAVQFNQQKDFDKGSPKINPNFLAPTAFQAPRSVQFTARYRF